MKKFISILTVMAILLLLTQCKKNCYKSERCNLKPDSGPCLAIFTKYYYDNEEKKCKEFIYGGCEGVVPFETREDCEKQCDCK
jgi:hypothetical protein